MRSIARMLAVAVMAATTITLLPTTPANAAGASCSDTRSSTIKFRVRGKRTAQEIVRDEGQISIVNKRTLREPFTVADLSFRVLACKSPAKGTWSALSITPDTTWYDLVHTFDGKTVRVRPKDLSYGFGAYPYRAQARGMSVVGRTCSQKPNRLKWLQVVHGALSIPIPKVHPAISIGEYVLNMTLPDAPADKYYCGAMGSVGLSWKYSSTGKAAHTLIGSKFIATSRSFPCRSLSPFVESCSDQHKTSLTFVRF